jgi:hypothetical protein
VTNMKPYARRKLGELLMTNFNASVSIMQKESDAKFKEEQKQRPPQSWPDVISISTGSAVPQEVCACVRVCNGCVERLCVCVCVCVCATVVLNDCVCVCNGCIRVSLGGESNNFCHW